jgi:hypothetical protein
MINENLLAEANGVREDFVEAVDDLGKLETLRALEFGSEELSAELHAARELAASPKLRQRFSPTFACAVVGSSNHGKTSILAEMFPELEQRGWLVTDVKDTTSQALVIRQPGPQADIESVFVHSWDEEQIKRLILSAEEANNRHHIRVRYLSGEIQIDGTEGVFESEDLRRFRFGQTISLHPFPVPYRLTPAEQADRRVIRSLTVKEEQDQVTGRPVLILGERPFTALQLRAVIKDVTLFTPFNLFSRWSGRPAAEFAPLALIDTPGLGVTGSSKDEVLRHVLENKSTQIVLELLRNDELDLIIHMVLCGESTQFSRLWGAVERQCGSEELNDLSERLVLAVNGFNRYFTNADLKRKWTDPEAAAREGDQFATSLDDNILKRMSERGTLKPARICFLDSRRIVEGLTGRGYKEAYAGFLPAAESWARPGGAGYSTLERLGILADYPENLQALCDPEDRGQGFLVRQVLALIRDQGARLFLRRALVRSRLLAGIRGLRTALLRFYDNQGQLQSGAFRAALHALLRPLRADGLLGVESFARDHIDGEIDGLVLRLGRDANGKKWVEEGFRGLCLLVFRSLAARAKIDGNLPRLVEPYLRERMALWRRSWGYESADLPPPSRNHPETSDLLRHCLTLHAREILTQLSSEGHLATAADVPQDEEDRARAAGVIQLLTRAEATATRLCHEQGIPVG